MQNNQNYKFKIIRNNNHEKNTYNLKNEEIENIIMSAAKLSNTSEVKIYFKNIPANEYTLGYKKFCGIKINDLVFYNPSLFDLYPNIIDFLYINHKDVFNENISSPKLNNKYFSFDKKYFLKSKRIIDSNLYLNLNISFDEIIKNLDMITELIYKEKVLKILIMSSAKN